MTFGGGRKRQRWVGWGCGPAPALRTAPAGHPGISTRLQMLLLQPPPQPQFLHLLKENGHFSGTAVLSNAERPVHRPIRCAGTACSGTHRRQTGAAPPSLIPWHRHVAVEPSLSSSSQGQLLCPSVLGAGPSGAGVSMQGCLRPPRSLIAAATFAGCRLAAGASWICLISVDGY